MYCHTESALTPPTGRCGRRSGSWSEKRIDFFGNAVQLGGPIAFAYIDGSHTYEQSTKDFQNVDRYLEPGGFIGDAPDFVEVGEAGIAMDDAMRRQRRVQLVG
jgi:Methyltransferase domain